MKPVLPAVAVLLSLALPACPWWDAGHRMIASIAEQALTPAEREKLKALLPAGETLSSLASRADEIRQHRQETKAWHYIDLPVREEVTLENIDSFRAKDGADLLSQIEREIAALKDTGLSLEARQENLMFLVHFMGDLHIPVHCADDHDKGGNMKEVRFFRPGSSRGQKTNLHALWDRMVGLDIIDGKIDFRTRETWKRGA